MSTTISPCSPLIELLRYVDAHGIPSKVGRSVREPYPDEDAVLVPVPSRVLRALRALADGEYVVQPTRMMAYDVIRRVVQIEETVIADGYADKAEAEDARAALERMRAGKPKRGAKR